MRSNLPLSRAAIWWASKSDVRHSGVTTEPATAVAEAHTKGSSLEDRPSVEVEYAGKGYRS